MEVEAALAVGIEAGIEAVVEEAALAVGKEKEKAKEGGKTMSQGMVMSTAFTRPREIARAKTTMAKAKARKTKIRAKIKGPENCVATSSVASAIVETAAGILMSCLKAMTMAAAKAKAKAKERAKAREKIGIVPTVA
jgi:hypothetical protein